MKKTINKHILYWVEQNIYSKATIKELVAYIGYSRRTLEKMFFNEYNLYIGKYIFKRRMTRAAVTLRLTRLDITEIAMMFHYYSGQNFSRAFRKCFGKSPTEYRDALSWDNNVLQLPLLLPANFNAELTEFSDVITISGEALAYKASYTTTDDYSFTEHVKDRVYEWAGAGQQNIWIAASMDKSTCLYSSRKGFVDIELVIGTSSVSKKITKDSYQVSTGQYATFQFHGAWDEYIVFSKLVYIKSLADNKFLWIGGASLLKIKSYDKERDWVDCILYIPIIQSE
ncbi:helix-turn-helix transcriptional regulator [Salmonella enterica subsp. enterica serovar Saintpaul]|nr:helix-turn-helix transcriptional regulator [Salmonella enterica]EHJ6659815.1 helix-turn-helix transcriptional regulator [Salmonella enterica subsp. enterica serovar Saintpaul]